MVTSAHIDAFRRDGFVVVPELLAAAELERFGVAVDAAVAARTRHDTRQLADKTPYEQSFQQCINLWEDHPAVRPLTFHPRVAAAAAALLGVAALRVWHDQALYKEAGGRPTDAHQDQGYWPIEEADTLTAWIPFDGSTLDGGAMGYVPGSHRFGVRKFVNIFFGEPEDLINAPEARGVEPVFVEVPCGGVAFHHGLTFHLAQPHRPHAPRAHGHLLPRRLHARLVVPASVGRPRRHRRRRCDRQRRDSHRLAAFRRRPAARSAAPGGAQPWLAAVRDGRVRGFKGPSKIMDSLEPLNP